MHATAESIRIGSATEADLSAIAQLARVIWHAHYPGIITTEQIEYMLQRMYALDTLQRELNELGIRFTCLWVGDSMAGFASFGPADQPGTVKLHKLYLKPDLHGRGLGSALLRHCEQEARQSGAREMILTVNKANTKAINAYQRNGFTVVKPVVADIGGAFVMDDFLMSKLLRA